MNNGIKARIEALQKQMDEQRPNGGILIRLSDSWMAFSASTIHKKSIFATEAEAWKALADCKSILEL